MQEVESYVQSLGRQARRAASHLVTLDGATKVAALDRMAARLRTSAKSILEANARDIEAAHSAGLAPALVERLKLNDRKIESMAIGVEQIAQQADPVGQTIEGYVRPNGLRIERRRVPLGVVLFFYE